MYDAIHSHDTINTTSPLHLKHMNKRGSKAATFQPRTICIKNDRLDLFDHGSIMDKNKKDQLFLPRPKSNKSRRAPTSAISGLRAKGHGTNE